MPVLEMQEMQVRYLGWEDPLEKEMANHFSILAWKIPRTEELVGYSPQIHKESDPTKHTHTHSVPSCPTEGLPLI